MKKTHFVADGFVINKSGIFPLVNIFVLVIITILFSNCNNNLVDPFNEDDFDSFINSLLAISTAMPVEKNEGIVNTVVDTTLEYIYKTDYYTAAAGFNEQIVLNPQTDVIYPGALIKG